MFLKVALPFYAITGFTAAALAAESTDKIETVIVVGELTPGGVSLVDATLQISNTSPYLACATKPVLIKPANRDSCKPVCG